MVSVIAIEKCTSYDTMRVQEAIEDCINGLGGVESFIDRGDLILLKPNLLMSAPPEENITTHPAIVEATAKILLDYEGEVVIGDSCGNAFGNIQNLWMKTGMKRVAQKLGLKLINFESSGSYIKRVGSEEYPIAKPVLECDFVVNLPKIKTHNLTILTCAIKNMYGAIPGLRKTDYHRRYPNPTEFSEKLVEIYELTKPNLNIVDGVIGMEGNGPSGGVSRELGMILASEDGVAIDIYISHILGMNPYKIPSNKIAIERGLGNGLNNIEIVGYEPKVIDDFKWPSHISYALEFLPSAVAKAVMNFWWSRPAIDERKCQNCKICIENCPVSALIEGESTPKFDYSKCVNCLCCMEICPHHTFYEDKSLLYKLTSRFSKKW